MPLAPAIRVLPRRQTLRHAGWLLLVVLGWPTGSAAGQATARDMRAALDAVCQGPQAVDAVLAALGGGIHLYSEQLDAPQRLTARRHRLMLPDGSRLRLDIHRRGERMVQVILELSERIFGRSLPRFWVVADGACAVRVARRLDYAAGSTPVAVEVLDASFQQVRSRLLLDEPVPPGEVVEGVPVALVDAGVNYTLPGLASRLARRANGSIFGYDYWDMDPRPFDSHTSRSPFLPVRHGTRTASLLLDDAPVATIVPMRYPRPDMDRMQRLVKDVAAAGITIVNLSLGGSEAEKWHAFSIAAQEHPEILFVASAGNDGRDLDAAPVWPAALELDNLITVTSADEQGLPARGSNWGRRSVDLLVPAENLVATDFSGYAVRVSGSSYAAARVSALAACLKAANPQWQAPELRQAIFRMARQPVHESLAYVSVGFLPEPTDATRGACEGHVGAPLRLGRLRLEESAIYPAGPPADATHALAALTLVWMRDAGWRLESLIAAAARAAQIFRQCGVRFTDVTVELVRVPRDARYFETASAMELMRSLSPPPPAAWFVRDTLQQPAFDAQAIGRSNLGARGPLLNTMWLTSHLRHPGVALAHELYHVLANTGTHVPETDNLMQLETRPQGTRLGDWQCARLLQVGKAFGLIVER